MSQAKWKFERQEGIEEQYRILKRELCPHDGYFRHNDGSWVVMEEKEDGGPVAIVVFQGKAKRGEGWRSPDPVGQARAHLIAAAPEMYEALKASRQLNLHLNKPGTIGAMVRDQIEAALAKAVPHD